MATDNLHNLDEGIEEYFEFVIFGHNYKFRYMNTNEIQELDKLKENPKKLEEYFYNFIEPADDKAPDFKEIQKKMTIPHLLRFNKMVKAEFSGNED